MIISARAMWVLRPLMVWLPIILLPPEQTKLQKNETNLKILKKQVEKSLIRTNMAAKKIENLATEKSTRKIFHQNKQSSKKNETILKILKNLQPEQTKLQKN